jgi:hypothetical protein
VKLLYQWAQRDPTDWQQVDSGLWSTLATRAEPGSGQIGGGNNVLGWVNDLVCQGLHFNGSDHLAVEDVLVGLEAGVRITNWWDDPIDNPPPERRARVWTILPLAPDPNLGGAINTRQRQDVYCEGQRFLDLSASPPQNTTVLPWASFVPPAAAITRHQVWLTDAKYAEHTLATRSFRGDRLEWGWRHWSEGLADREITLLPDGRRELKSQREQGRYKPSEHTLTWFQRDTNLAQGWIAATHEDSLLGTAGAGGTESVTTNSGLVICWAWATPANEPNSADWPSGIYRIQFDCTAASTGLTYAPAPVAITFRFVRAASDLSSSINAINQTISNFSGTGLKLATQDVDPNAGAADERLGCSASATGDSHGDAITMRFSADAFADGPWPSAGADDMPPYMDAQGWARNIRVSAY